MTTTASPDLASIEADIRPYLARQAAIADETRGNLRKVSDTVTAERIRRLADELVYAEEWERIVEFIDGGDPTVPFAVRVAEAADIVLSQVLALAPRMAEGNGVSMGSPQALRAWSDFVDQFHPLYHGRGSASLKGVQIDFGKRRTRI